MPGPHGLPSAFRALSHQHGVTTLPFSWSCVRPATSEDGLLVPPAPMGWAPRNLPAPPPGGGGVDPPAGASSTLHGLHGCPEGYECPPPPGHPRVSACPHPTDSGDPTELPGCDWAAWVHSPPQGPGERACVLRDPGWPAGQRVAGAPSPARCHVKAGPPAEGMPCCGRQLVWEVRVSEMGSQVLATGPPCVLMPPTPSPGPPASGLPSSPPSRWCRPRCAPLHSTQSATPEAGGQGPRWKEENHLGPHAQCTHTNDSR